MANYFSISGYFKDDKSELDDFIEKDTFEGFIVKDTHDFTDDEDEYVFYFGLSEDEIKSAIAEGEDTALEFVITSYESC